ncbi:MAG: MFS transporter [Promethearchaeia archaeon]
MKNFSKVIKDILTSDYEYPSLTPLWIGLFIDVLGFYIIIPFLPTFIEVFETTPFVIGLLLATNAVFTFIFAPIWGNISDRIGRKPVLLISQAGTFMAFMMLAFSNSLELLFIARVVDGVFGGNFPTVKAIITDTVPPKDRGLQMTNVGVVHVLAGLIGPGLGGILSVIRILGPEFPMATAGLAASGMSLASILVTIFFVEESWPKSLREKAKKEIKVHLKLRNNKSALYLLTQYGFHTFSFTLYMSNLTLYIGVILGLDALGIGILLTISGITRALVRFTLFKPTLRYLGEKRMTELGLLIVAVSFFLIVLVDNIWIFLIFMLLISYGVSCSRGLLTSKLTQSVKPDQVGKINGYTTTMDSLARVFGPIIGSAIFSFSLPFWWGVLMGVIATVAFVMVFKKVKVFRKQQERFQQEKSKA